MSLHREIQESINRCMYLQALWVAVINNPHATDRFIESAEENCARAHRELNDLLERVRLRELDQDKEDK